MYKKMTLQNNFYYQKKNQKNKNSGVNCTKDAYFLKA